VNALNFCIASTLLLHYALNHCHVEIQHKRCLNHTIQLCLEANIEESQNTSHTSSFLLSYKRNLQSQCRMSMEKQHYILKDCPNETQQQRLEVHPLTLGCPHVQHVQKNIVIYTILGQDHSLQCFYDCVILQLKALAALRAIFKEHSDTELAAILLSWVRSSCNVGL
jgi:hypothetical protein